MRNYRAHCSYFYLGIILVGWFCASPLLAQEEVGKRSVGQTDVLTESEWEDVNDSVDRALNWLASRQQRNGSFPTSRHGQPGVTSLCTLAFLAQGHLPNEGKYGQTLAKSLDFIAACQRRNGLLASTGPNELMINRNVGPDVGVAASYNHALAGIALCESYGISGPETSEKLQPVIEKALLASFQMNDWRKERAMDAGGWRYLHKKDQMDSDLSVTGWQLMFLRSAKNAGFDVAKNRIQKAVGYIRRSFEKERGSFIYKLKDPNGNRTSRGMAGAGILALAHSGLHQSDEAQRAGEWVLKSGFRDYNAQGRIKTRGRNEDRYFYGLLTCGPAMYQLGGRHWREFFPPTAAVLMKNQNEDGSWDPENHRTDSKWGNEYTTAVGVLVLSAANELLPIYQR